MRVFMTLTSHICQRRISPLLRRRPRNFVQCFGRTITTSTSTSAANSLREPTEVDVKEFQDILKHHPGSVLTDVDDVESYNTDWTVRT